MKQREVVYSPEAADDLAWIYDLIADAGSPVTARRYEQRLRAYCDGLGYASERGAKRDDLREGLRIIGFERRVTIAFMVDDRVVILRIFYGGADWERLDW